MEFVEVKGRTVDVAVQAALAELGLTSAEKAEIEVLQQPERGFLGLGGREAIVRVRAKRDDASSKKRRSRKPRSSSSSSRGGSGSSKQQTEAAEKAPANPKPASASGRNSARNDRQGQGSNRRDRNPESESRNEGPELTIEEQASVVEEFLIGLLAAYGLDGTVTTSVEDEVILASVSGDQTEALVGTQGTVMDAVHEVCRTVLQRRSRHAARLRIDIAGYAERRRQALRIYAARLADQVTEEGGEIMLEPMNASDRKVIHDAISEVAGVRSYSEGEPPDRYVVISVDTETAEPVESGVVAEDVAPEEEEDAEQLEPTPE